MSQNEITHILQAYAFTSVDKSALTTILANAYLQGKEQAYSRAYATAGHRFSFAVWKPGADDTQKAEEWATPIVDSITSTYEGLLRGQLEQMRPVKESDGEDGDSQDDTPDDTGDQGDGIVGNVLAALGISTIVKKIGEWFTGFLPWKSEQIAQNTWSEGDNDGTEQFVADAVNSGDDYSGLIVKVMPASSSSDYCKDFAGNTYLFDEIGGDVPSFPTHANCIHYIVVIDTGEVVT